VTAAASHAAARLGSQAGGASKAHGESAKIELLMNTPLAVVRNSTVDAGPKMSLRTRSAAATSGGSTFAGSSPGRAVPSLPPAASLAIARTSAAAVGAAPPAWAERRTLADVSNTGGPPLLSREAWEQQLKEGCKGDAGEEAARRDMLLVERVGVLEVAYAVALEEVKELRDAVKSAANAKQRKIADLPPKELRDEVRQLRHDVELTRVRAALESRELYVAVLSDLTASFDKEVRWTASRLARLATAEGRALSAAHPAASEKPLAEANVAAATVKPTHVTSVSPPVAAVPLTRPASASASRSTDARFGGKASCAARPASAAKARTARSTTAAELLAAASTPASTASNPAASVSIANTESDARLLPALQSEVAAMQQSYHRALHLATRTLRGRLLPSKPTTMLDEGMPLGSLDSSQARWLQQACTVLFPHCLVCVFDPCSQDLESRESPWTVLSAAPQALGVAQNDRVIIEPPA